MTRSTAMIRTAHLTKIYPGIVPTRALEDVSFEIAAGEFIAITGRSGSGKSTLLHQLSLIDTPTSGSIFIDGIDALALSRAEQTHFRLERLGYVFQEYALLVEMDALQNVMLPAIALGRSGDLVARAKLLLQRVGLGERLDHYPNELSGGEQQRVAIARALMNDPKIIFADEPTANLDSVSANVVLTLFSTLNVKFGQTIVMVTHEPEDKKYVDRVMWLKDGQIESTKKGGRQKVA